MFSRLPLPPPGSAIKMAENGDTTTLKWQRRCSVFKRPGALPAAGFFAVWLCGWAVGEVMVSVFIFNMLNGRAPASSPTANWLSGPLTVFWLCGWTFGGIVAIRMLVRILRGYEPVTITLTDDVIRLKHAGLHSPAGETAGSLKIRGVSADEYVRGAAEWPDNVTASDPHDVALPVAETAVQYDRDVRPPTLRLVRGDQQITIAHRLEQSDVDWLADALESHLK